MIVSLILRPTDLHEDRHGRTGIPKRKILVFTAAVFVISTASVVALLLHLGQGTTASLAVGTLIGATAAIEVGWFGGRVLFERNGE